MARKPQAVDFEKALAELEKQVTLLESGDLSLEESLKSFEAGIRLTRECQQALTEAEQKVRILLEKSDGSVAFKPLNDEEDAEVDDDSPF
jgi:exodeoxyribonuclease VII small subunit